MEKPTVATHGNMPKKVAMANYLRDPVHNDKDFGVVSIDVGPPASEVFDPPEWVEGYMAQAMDSDTTLLTLRKRFPAMAFESRDWDYEGIHSVYFGKDDRKFGVNSPVSPSADQVSTAVMRAFYGHVPPAKPVRGFLRWLRGL